MKFTLSFICCCFTVCLFAQSSVQNFGIAPLKIDKLKNTKSEAEMNPNVESLNSHGVYAQGFHKAAILVAMVQEGTDDYSIMVFPNPTNNEILLKVLDPNKGLLSVEMKSLEDKIVYEDKLESMESRNTSIDLTAFPSGNYTLVIKGLEKKFTNIYQITKKG